MVRIIINEKYLKLIHMNLIFDKIQNKILDFFILMKLKKNYII